MKLAEALIVKKDLNIEIDNLQTRLLETVKVQDGTIPFQKPEFVMDKLKSILSELDALTTKIHKTNNATQANVSNTLNELISKRDIVKRKHKILNKAYQEIFTRDRYATRSEVKYTIAVDVNNLLKSISDAAKQFRVLDTQIQTINWTTELL